MSERHRTALLQSVENPRLRKQQTSQRGSSRTNADYHNCLNQSVHRRGQSLRSFAPEPHSISTLHALSVFCAVYLSSLVQARSFWQTKVFFSSAEQNSSSREIQKPIKWFLVSEPILRQLQSIQERFKVESESKGFKFSIGPIESIEPIEPAESTPFFWILHKGTGAIPSFQALGCSVTCQSM